MALASQVKADMIAAMKAGERDKLAALRFVSSEISRAAKDAGLAEADDALALKVLDREAKRRRDAIALAREGGRDALDEVYELELIASYLPAQLSDAELEETVKGVVQPGMALGEAMRAAGAAVQWRADGARVAAVVRAILQ